MEINLGEEKIIELVSPFPASEVHERMLGRKMDAFGQLVKFMQRPKWDEIVISHSEKRYEPFWYGSAVALYEYDRRRRFSVEVGPEVQSVMLYDQEHPVLHDKGHYFTLDGVQHCVEEIRRELMLDPVRGEERDYSRYLNFEKNEIPTLEALQQEDAVVIPPEVRSSFLVRKLVQMLMKTFQADTVQKERIDVDFVYLYCRPVYAFEYHWIPRDKRTVMEFDGLTGEVRTEGGQMTKQVAKVLENDALFDIGADALGTLVPGAGLAVKVGRLAARKALE